ncbi:hypothetical protein [Bacteroides timonensis]|uniref:hypothetical protein n=1 Tax=Bacteroides timonensis TaxID=1470345 RepID=UPI000F77F236|nr:hypothetical protein [Bacteroides timonensis]
MKRTNNIITENGHLSKIKAVRKTVFSACGGVFILAAAFSLTGCVKDELHNTPHPDKGAIVVQMDWSDLLPEAVADNYILNVDGYEQTVSGSTNTVERLSEPGEHSLMVYNKPQGITINGDIASVNEIIDGRSVGSRVEPLPDYLFSISEKVIVEKDDTLRIKAKPRQWVRQLDMELSVSEGDYKRIVAVTGTLSGIEQSVDIRKGERLGTAVIVNNDFTVAEDKCNTSFRLMGIVPTEHQTLTVHIVFSNGDTQTIESDLSEQMAAFHDGNAPLTLTGSLNLPIEVGATGSISNWIVVDNGTTDIH